MTTSAAIQPSRPFPGSPLSSANHHDDELEEDPPVRPQAALPQPIQTSADMPPKSPQSCLRKQAPPPPSSPSRDPRTAAAARSRGLLRAMIERFSSTPLELSPSKSAEPRPNASGDTECEDYDDESSAWLHNSVVVSPAPSRHATPALSSSGRRSASLATTGSNCGTGLLTDSERAYLERLLEAGNPEDMEAASHALKDSCTFFEECEMPPAADEKKEEDDGEGGVLETSPSPNFETNVRAGSSRGGAAARRDSRLQQQLYHLHETTSVQPSLVVSRMSLLLERFQKHYQSNSIIQASFSNDDDLNSIMSSDLSPQHQKEEDWDPFEDVASWLGEAHGLRADDSPLDNAVTSSAVPFKILGTYGSDTSCHPHVLSPPLMEALLNFCPEAATDPSGTANNNNLWLKYSRSRDGGALAQLLRLVRASSCTIVAVETSTGHVLGCFTSRPWRLSGEADPACGDELESSSFVWKMRHPRYLATPTQSSSPLAARSASPTARRSIVQQVCQESEIQVFPFRSAHSAPADAASAAATVQSCSLERGIRIGQNELEHLSSPQQLLTGTHLGHALVIDPTLLSGSTSTSETFGNPCLTNEALRGESFDIVNLEVWALTPHATIAEAERRELSRLFLRSGR